MADYYADSSVLVKRHVRETGTGLAAPVFTSSDDRLLNAAQLEGLFADNPNLHP